MIYPSIKQSITYLYIVSFVKRRRHRIILHSETSPFHNIFSKT